MTNKLSFALLGLALAVAIATPADAANKEVQQMMADIRMLQEQSQQVQNLIASLTGSLTASLTFDPRIGLSARDPSGAEACGVNYGLFAVGIRTLSRLRPPING